MKVDRILLGVFLLSMAVYIALFAACFSELPINPTPLCQTLLFYFHGVPMFFLQLVLYRLSVRWWRHLVPFLPMVVVGLVFLHAAEWYILGWIIVLWWCVAPIAGWLLAWAVHRRCRLHRKGDNRNA